MNIFQFWHTDKPEENNLRFQSLKKLLIEMLYQQKQNITVEIKNTRKDTSDKARGYIFGVIIPSAIKGLRDLGNDIPENKIGEEYVYQFLKAQGSFFEIKEIKFADGTTSSFAEFESFGKDGDLKRQTEFIDFCIRFCAEELQISIPSPEEWKLQRGVK